jgi:magnesium transporter
MKKNISKDTIEKLLSNTEEFKNYHSSEIAKTLKKIYLEDGKEKFLEYIKKIPQEHLGGILLELPEYIKDEALIELSVNKLVDTLNRLDSDDAADLLQDIRDVSAEKEQQILSKLDDENAKEIKALNLYSQEQAGSLMQTELFQAKLDEPIKDAIERLKKLKNEDKLENIYQVFLVDEFGLLVGSMPLEDVITFDFNKTFRDYLSEKYRHIQYLKATDPIEDAIKLFEDFDLVVLPVVDEKNRLIGRITYDDIVDVIEERATEQIYKMAGVDDESEEDRDIATITKTRAIWLGINLITAILASFVIGLFDETIQSYVALAILMPIVASMGGNAGTQSLTVVVRQLALDEVSWNEAKNSIKREVIVSLLNGIIFAVVMGIIASLWFNDGRLGIVIGLSMVVNLFFAGLFGSIIPLTLKRLGIDPAVASSVLLTTVTDVVGFLAFLGLAKVILLS